jgi:hypothetical protein
MRFTAHAVRAVVPPAKAESIRRCAGFAAAAGGKPAADKIKTHIGAIPQIVFLVHCIK